uniref:N-6 DNA methylase n=1 Tax=uncultured Mucilaginibacter sp. TaxID=797541 RepID=UPI0025FD96B7
LKSDGKGAVILPHGVLFRGGSEGEIRKNLVKKGYNKGIIGLPANLFYGTTIPACIVVIDKENAHLRKGIFIIDASKGFVKDGNKNRLREQDIHKIVDVFTKHENIAGYSRLVSFDEIGNEKNEYSLNIPRYIDNQEQEDIQDIEAHLLGGIPNADIDALHEYWKVYPSLRKLLFAKSERANYSVLKVDKDAVKQTIFNHPEFTAFSVDMDKVFAEWRKRTTDKLTHQKIGFKPKHLIQEIAEDLLLAYSNRSLVDKYDVYQHLMAYWSETMQDDVYVISDDGWKAGREVYRISKSTKDKAGTTKKKDVDGLEGIESKLIKPYLVVDKYFTAEKQSIEALETERDTIAAQLEEMEEEHGAEDGLMVDAKNDKDKITAASIKDRLKKIKGSLFDKDERELLEAYLKLTDAQSELNKTIKEQKKELETLVWDKYPQLSDAEIKTLVVDDKWIQVMDDAIHTEMQRISQRLTQRINELADRYETPLPLQLNEVQALEEKVNAHLAKMGFLWN